MSNLLNTLLIILMLLITSNASSQNIELGIHYGYSLYFGDLTPSGSKFSFTRGRSVYGYSLGYGNEKGTIYVSYNRTILSADDKNATSGGRVSRNLNFETNITEWGVGTELNLLSTLLKKNTRLQPTISFGINVFSFNPLTKIGDSLIELRPLTIEDKTYSLTQINIPLGVGVRYNGFDRLWVGAGLRARITFTDYIDDVSLRGNSDKNDWYMISYITVGYNLYTIKKNCIICPFEY